ncbi:hypothetical protein PR202_gb06092 [Eleusine coracana subsp. coracana]|uniref:Alkaline/neutral invertase n=1 Tax=Eleusine coracana subsp. coracana TaxID=191504 RepID=A0AAV5E8S7_ELECO|nr:hypothetical protein PR202_gb06092 [Eleusine coracana subsp. coracana]
MVLCSEPPRHIKLPESRDTELTDDDNHDSSKFEKRTRMHHIERHRSCVMTLSDIEHNDVPSKSPVGGSQCSPHHEETPTDTNASHRHAIADAAWEALKRSVVYFRGQPIGTVAAIDKSQGAALNYDQVFMRDFIPSALAFLMKGEHSIVKNFLVETARLQSREKMVDLFKLGQGVMPASFKVHHRNTTQETESLLADFGETAIGRVAPVDSGLWWIILLRAYTKSTGDNALAESPNCQRAMRLILRLCLSEGCDTSPALLCADGCSMIDRKMTALNKFNVIPESIPDWIFDFMPSRGGYFIGNVSPARMDFRWFCLGNFIAILSSLATGEQAEAILDLVEERWPELIGEMPLKICYPAMENQEWQIVTGCDPKNTRWSYHNAGSWPGHLTELFISLTTVNPEKRTRSHPETTCSILMLLTTGTGISSNGGEGDGDLAAGEGVSGDGDDDFAAADPCNGVRTMLLWLLVAVSVKLGRPHLARKAMELMERRLVKDDFPEYYDGKAGRYIGKQARKFQTWSIAGYLVAKMLLDDPSHLRIIALEDDGHSRSGMPFLKRSNSCP